MTTVAGYSTVGMERVYGGGGGANGMGIWEEWVSSGSDNWVPLGLPSGSG